MRRPMSLRPWDRSFCRRKIRHNFPAVAGIPRGSHPRLVRAAVLSCLTIDREDDLRIFRRIRKGGPTVPTGTGGTPNCGILVGWKWRDKIAANSRHFSQVAFGDSRCVIGTALLKCGDRCLRFVSPDVDVVLIMGRPWFLRTEPSARGRNRVRDDAAVHRGFEVME